MRKTLFLIAGAGVLFGCAKEEGPKVSCPTLRQTYERAFEQAVKEGAEKHFDRQERYISEGQKAYLTMQSQGCCKVQGACPPLNVR